ncbi:outer membrane protein assembly factor BamA [Bdellovibrio bacteriovorus]|uniref:Outer membrane protein assembly factor BamA n=1 Tax=Bdellovibrio bacteriovorus TaxID=959 RepID=A0A150WMB3_BDEBC|nr:outer membrane protein assembly factor BamA [Bdellovibrio bacteriovorus]KYG64965.1 outer membrane protein assembly factor BamA [Bdellovibrio bacteriovorus]
MKKHTLSQLLCVLLVTSLTTVAGAQSTKRKKATAPKKSATATTAMSDSAAASSMTIKAIEITGNKKIEKDAILAKITSKVGATYSAAAVREDVEAIFKLGFFNNIEVDRQVSGREATLTYKVLEKPSITEIIYEGNSEVKADDIADASGIKAYQLLNMTKVKEAVEKIQKLYEDKGFFLAKVEAEVRDVTKDETVQLVFKVRENDKVKVKQITILGNKHLSDDELKSKMLTKEGGFFSAMSGSGQYKQEMFERDVQILRFLYYNKGYVQAKVDRPQVTVTPDKKTIYITLRVEEGEQYDVGEVDFAGDILFPRQELYEAIKIDDNGVFAYDVLQKDISELTAKYGDLGYAYANVIPRTAFNAKERKVNLIFEFDKGSKVYFGKINVVGNSKTRDKVVRRELKVVEGELYNETRRRQSLENIQRLGFFEEVNFKTSVDPERNDVMNIDIAVKERNTGQIQLGAGYGTSNGFTLQGSVNQSNFLGKGQNLGASLNMSGNSSYYSLSFTEPYFQDTLWSVGGDVYQSANTARNDYDEEHRGGAIRFGHPIAEYTRGYLRYKYDDTKLGAKSFTENNTTYSTDQDLFPLATANGVTSSITGILEYDTRNDRQMPTKGMLASGSYEYAGVGGDLKFTRINANYRFYRNLFWDVTWRNNLQYSRIDSLEGQDVPFNELYLLGGPYSLRGYRSYHVGKMKRSKQLYDRLINQGLSPAEADERSMRFYGGTQQAMFQTELQFPLVKEAGIMGAVFFDAGAADDVLTDQNYYMDTGFGVRWYSPIGVLRFEWGFPLNRDTIYHDATVFEFSIGPSF